MERYTLQQREVLKARPGMTGLAQVQYMQNEAAMLDATTLDEVYLNKILPNKLELDLQYIQNQSFLLDLKFLVQTIFITLIEKEQQ